MPSFGADAYKERGCYGQPLADDAGTQIDDDIADLLGAQGETRGVEVVRRRTGRAVTPEECAWYYEERASSFCDAPK